MHGVCPENDQLLASCCLSWQTRKSRGRTHQRCGRCHTRCWGTKAELMQGFGVELPRWIQPMGLLKALHGLGRGIVPLPVRGPRVCPTFRQRGLNLGDALRRRRLLHLPATARFLCRLGRFAVMRRCSGFRSGWFFLCWRLPPHRTSRHTQPRCDKQRQGQEGRCSQSHRRLLNCGVKPLLHVF